jgi:hypothetical protein
MTDNAHPFPAYVEAGLVFVSGGVTAEQIPR